MYITQWLFSTRRGGGRPEEDVSRHVSCVLCPFKCIERSIQVLPMLWTPSSLVLTLSCSAARLLSQGQMDLFNSLGAIILCKEKKTCPGMSYIRRWPPSLDVSHWALLPGCWARTSCHPCDSKRLYFNGTHPLLVSHVLGKVCNSYAEMSTQHWMEEAQ